MSRIIKKHPVWAGFLATLSLLALVVCGIAAPAWWSEGDPPVIDPNATENNHAVANIGQAKWMAKRALETIQAQNPSLASAIEADLVGEGKPIPTWDVPADKTTQKSPLLTGQLKAIAHPFYEHLNDAVGVDWVKEQIEANLPTGSTLDVSYEDSEGRYFPWTTVSGDDHNKSPANIGQVKFVFSIELSEVLNPDSDGDGLPDVWEYDNFGDLITSDGTGDQDGDGLLDKQEYTMGTNPDNNDTDGDGVDDGVEANQGTNPINFYDSVTPQLEIVTGNNQNAIAGNNLDEPFRVRVLDGSGQPIENAPVDFLVVSGGGYFPGTNETADKCRAIVTTDAEGHADISFFYEETERDGAVIVAYARGTSKFSKVEFTVNVICNSPPPPGDPLAWLTPGVLTGNTGDSISQWNDSTTNENHASQVSGQADTTLPTITTQDGLLAADFDGANDRLAFPSELGEDNFTIFVLARPEATRTSQTPDPTYAGRNAGRTDQRVILGSMGSGDNFWPPITPDPPEPLYFTRWQDLTSANLSPQCPMAPLHRSPEAMEIYTGCTIIYRSIWDTHVPNPIRYDVTNSGYYTHLGTVVCEPPATANMDKDELYTYFKTADPSSNYENHFKDWETALGRPYFYTDRVGYEQCSPSPYNELWVENAYKVYATNYLLEHVVDTATPPQDYGDTGMSLSLGTNGAGFYEAFDNLEGADYANGGDYLPSMANASFSTNNDWVTLSVVVTDKKASIYQGGSLVATGLDSLATSLGGVEFLGGSGENQDFFDGQIAEVIIYDSVLSDTERTEVEEWLAERRDPSGDANGNNIPDLWEECKFPDGFVGSEDSDNDGVDNASEYTLGTDPLIADTDGDGLSDGEEAAYGTDPLIADTDSDGYLDGHEVYVTSTIPTEADYLDADNNGIADSWDYWLDYNPAFIDNDGDRIPNSWEVANGYDPNNAYDRYQDDDGDLLDAWYEYTQGSSPFIKDTDSDGLDDFQEYYMNTNPNDPDTDGNGTGDYQEDYDDDGLTNQYELETSNTDPTHDDTDLDGLLDGYEVQNGFDPLNSSDVQQDTDGDGLTTAHEIQLGTNPNLEDTDGDLLVDGIEIEIGTNPLEEDSDGNGTPDGDEDYDGDTISNIDEINNGTSLVDPDTDGDGTNDNLDPTPRG